MKRQNPVRIEMPQIYGAIPMTHQQAEEIFGDELPALLKTREMRGDMKTFGYWQTPLSYTAHATTSEWAGPPEEAFTRNKAVTFYGKRTMTYPKESGYVLEGRASVLGRKRRAFTSSSLIDIDGTLVEIATVHVCIDKPK